MSGCCTGKSDFDAIENKRDDTFFAAALGVAKVPSSPSLRQRFDEHASGMIPLVDKASIDFIADSRGAFSSFEAVDANLAAG